MSHSQRFDETRFLVQADCHDCIDRDRSAWCGLPGADLDALNAQKRCLVVWTRQLIHQQDEECRELLLIQEGVVAVRKTDLSGSSFLVRLCYPGDCLGYRELLNGARHSTSAEALKATRICRIGRTTVMEALERNSGLSARFLHMMGEDLAMAENTMLRMATWSTRARVVHLWLALKDRFGTVSDDGEITLMLPLSQQQIGTLLGVRRETVARSIRDLADDGIVRSVGNVVMIRDLDQLFDELDRLQS